MFHSSLDSADKGSNKLEDIKIEYIQICEGSEILPYLQDSLP